jgi:hypothetical protein
MAVSATMGIWAQHYWPMRALIEPSRLVRSKAILKASPLGRRVDVTGRFLINTGRALRVNMDAVNESEVPRSA